MVNYFFYRLGQFMALHLPLKLAYRIAVFISDLRYIFAFRDKRFVTKNLKTIFPEKSAEEIAKIRIWLFRNFAKYLVDFFRYEKLDNEYIKKNIRIDNLSYFDDALKNGKGVIILSAHIGNWELGAVVVALSGYPLWAVALEHKEKEVNDFFDSQRKSKGVNVIPFSKAVRQCLDLLNDNKIIALVGDRDFTGNGVITDFFGKRARFPDGPAAFALKTGASILPCFMVRNPDDSFTLKIEKPFQFVSQGDKKEDIKMCIHEYIKIFEGYIRNYPEQWYIFRKFWID
ncbi:MAG: lysophospholipid acyltransferase family protein [Candidatus Omnitrophota bacterium]